MSAATQALRGETDELVRAMAAIVGAAQISTDATACALAGADLVESNDHALPDLVVRPADTQQVAAVLATAAHARRPVVPRGAGLSYTRGLAAPLPAIVLDLTALNGIYVDADNMFAVVGAGCTWQMLADALEPHGLRSVLSGPISGCHSTVGGAVAQAVPGSMDAILGVTAVLADATVVRTGSWALPDSLAFYRQHGPDLTGLFVGDCGAFAVKTEIALRLETIKPVAFESYAFETSMELLAAMTAVMRRGLATRAIAFDRMKLESAKPQGAREKLETVASVVRQTGSMRQMVRDVVAMRKAPGQLDDAPWSLHMTIASVTDAGAAAQAEAVRRICDAHGQRIEAVVPKALHDKPYSVRGFVGPQGERWAPVHGIFPFSRAAAAMSAMEAHLAECSGDMAQRGVKANWLLSSSGSYVVAEPMFYWPDALDPLHMQYLSERNRARFGATPANPTGRALVDALRRALRDIMDTHGAAHGQIGRFYRLTDIVEPGTASMLARIKTALDPEGRMNPGALGL